MRVKTTRQKPHYPWNVEDQLAFDTLNSLLQENKGPTKINTLIKRKANLRIRSQKMPPLSKNKWLKIFLDLVQTDLEKVNWTQKTNDNLTTDKWRAFNDLQKRKDIFTKRVTREET